jgi:hypothetical protein
MGEDYPQVELNIEVDDNKIQPAILETLPFSELELVVKHTLHLAGITQPVALSLLITGDETIHTLIASRISLPMCSHSLCSINRL